VTACHRRRVRADDRAAAATDACAWDVDVVWRIHQDPAAVAYNPSDAYGFLGDGTNAWLLP
jgi:hypothetical protein